MTEMRLVDTPQPAVDAAERCLQEFGYDVTGDCAVQVAHAVLSAAGAINNQSTGGHMTESLRIIGGPWHGERGPNPGPPLTDDAGQMIGTYQVAVTVYHERVLVWVPN